MKNRKQSMRLKRGAIRNWHPTVRHQTLFGLAYRRICWWAARTYELRNWWQYSGPVFFYEDLNPWHIRGWKARLHFENAVGWIGLRNLSVKRGGRGVNEESIAWDLLKRFHRVASRRARLIRAGRRKR